MEDRWDTQRLLALRRLTRQVTEIARPELAEALATLKPLFRPRSVLGDHIASSSRQAIKGADKAFAELKDLYDRVAPGAPYRLERGLESPIDLVEPDLELSAIQYRHAAKSDRGSKSVVVTQPLRWVLSFAGFSLERLRALLVQPERSAQELRAFVLHALALHLVVEHQKGLGKILAALHFPLRTQTMPEFGELPIAVIGLPLETQLPPDDVILESTEISGSDAFEEVVVPGAIAALQDDLRGRLEELMREPEASLRQPDALAGEPDTAVSAGESHPSGSAPTRRTRG